MQDLKWATGIVTCKYEFVIVARGLHVRFGSWLYLDSAMYSVQRTGGATVNIDY